MSGYRERLQVWEHGIGSRGRYQLLMAGFLTITISFWEFGIRLHFARQPPARNMVVYVPRTGTGTAVCLTLAKGCHG